MSGAAFGKQVAQFAKDQYLDGVDFDMENFGGGLQATGLTINQTIQWLIDCSNAARSVLGNNSIITHAPQAPYFGNVGFEGVNRWTVTQGGYSAVYKNAPHIDYLLVQFYNQGASCYITYKGLIENSTECTNFPGTSIKEIASYGIPLDKIVLGKPMRQQDAGTGQMSASAIAGVVQQAKQSIGWNGGVMVWTWHGKDESATWIQTIYPNSSSSAVKSAVGTVNTTQNATQPVVQPQATTKPAAISTNTSQPQATTKPAVTSTITITQQATSVSPAKTASAATPAPQSSTPTPTTASTPQAVNTTTPTKCVSGVQGSSDLFCQSVRCPATLIQSGVCKLV
jgi:hypothetical protein